MSDFAEWLRAAAREAATDQTAAAVSSVFAEEPVSLTIFVQDKGFLGNPPLSAVQYDAVRHIERIYYAATYPQLAEEFDAAKKPGRFVAGAVSAWREEAYWSQPTRMINFATLQWGKGSGKDHVARLASMRIAYLLMCLHSPQDYYGMPEQDTIHLLNVASSSGQAQQAFFMPIVRAVKRGWFANQCQPRQNVISFAKNIEAVSGHSDAESQEGLNLMLGTADEIDAFKSKKEMSFRRGTSPREPTKSAEGILNMMKSSGSTRFPEVFKQVRISYPRYLGSTIQQLTDEARKDLEANGPDSRHYVSGPLATWHVNPRVPGRDAFAGDYREDPVLARSKYECKPARAVNPYFRNHQAVDACIVRVDVPPVEVSYTIETAGSSRVWVPQYSFARDFFPVRGAIYAMHADLAVSGDRAGIALAHVVKWTEHEVVAVDEDEAVHPVRHVRPHVKADFVFSYTSDTSADPPREIQIRWARQLAFELIRRGFNIKRFSFDHFQSVDSMQILETRGIETEKVSTDLHEDPWRNLRDLMYEGRVSFPGPSIVDETNPPQFLLRDELLSLTRMPNGRINHPSDGCFVGETRIPLLDGSAPQIRDLEGKGVWVYSATPEGRIVPGWARARRTKVVKRLVDVVLDNGYVARCTPDHLWMLRDGTYKPAQDLIPGVDRLMPITRNLPMNGGYERVTDKDGCRTLTHTLVAKEVRSAADSNHKVRSVIPVELEQPVPVFDLEVDRWHNFALLGGVFVHNSKDEADALACAVLGAIAVGGAEEETGERAYYSQPEFTVGSDFPMPVGVNMGQVWESEFPSPF